MIERSIAPSRRSVIRALATLSVGSLPTMTVASAAPLLVCAPAAPESYWAALLAVYQAAHAAEFAYDAKVIDPHFVGVDRSNDEAWRRAATPITQAMWDELERPMDARLDAEAALLECPSPDANAFALKYTIVHGNGRDISRWDDVLEAEARQFSGRASA